MRKMRFHIKDHSHVFVGYDNLCQRFYLWCRGYKKHETLFGYVMKKWEVKKWY